MAAKQQTVGKDSILVSLHVRYEQAIKAAKAPYASFDEKKGYAFSGVPKEDVPYVLGNFMRASGVKNFKVAAAILLHDSLINEWDYGWRAPAEQELAKLVNPALARLLLERHPSCSGEVKAILESKLRPDDKLVIGANAVLEASTFFSKLHSDGQELLRDNGPEWYEC